MTLTRSRVLIVILPLLVTAGVIGTSLVRQTPSAATQSGQHGLEAIVRNKSLPSSSSFSS